MSEVQNVSTEAKQSYFSNWLSFQPGMTMTVYLQAQTLVFRNCIYAGITITDVAILELETPEGKVVFQEWCGIGYGSKAMTTDFLVKSG